MNPKRTPPTPIFDDLASMGNPFKQTHFSVAAFFPSPHATAPRGIKVDYEYALKFLYSYNGSAATFNVYRREIERFFQWAWRIQQHTVLRLKREDIEVYMQFCLNPPLDWIGTKQTPRFREKEGQRTVNAAWRPFVVSLPKDQVKASVRPDKKDFLLSQSSVKAIFTALSSFYDFLSQENLTDSNPVALIRQKSKFIRQEQQLPSVRRISNLQWGYVIETAEHLADNNPAAHERTLFMMNCLFAMYLRISELVADERSSPAMKDFKKDMDGNWWLYVTGKGNKLRKITVSDAMLNALKRYRKYLGLTALPTAEDRTPLLPKQIGKGPITSTRHIRSIVQQCFDAAYDRMSDEGLQDDAAELRTATVHWLRHTGISEDVKFRPREHVRDDAGHQSMQTTDRYIESDERERHQSGKRKKIREI